MIQKKFLLFASLFVLSTLLWLIFSRPKYECISLLNSNYFSNETNNYISDKVIIIKNDLISDILDADHAQLLKTKCQPVDLNGAYLYPGFIDSHTHLLAVDKQRVSDWKSALELSSARDEKKRLSIGEINAKSMLFAGFTTVRDLGNSGFYLDEKLKTKISPGPEILTSGPGITISPSQIDLKKYPSEYTVIDEHSDIDRVLQNYKSHNVSWIKLYADNSNNGHLIKQSLLDTVTRRAQSLDFKVAIHAEYADSIKNSLKSNPNSIEHFYEIPTIKIKKMKASPYIVLTDYSLQTCKNASIEKNCENKILSLKNRIAWLKNNHFKLVFGSDSVLDFTSDFNSRGEASLSSLINLTKMGLSPLEAILTATAVPAEMLGLPIGKIKKNYTANLIVFHADPLINLNNIKDRSLIMFRGKIICNNTFACVP